jgi:hypothetical protein
LVKTADDSDRISASEILERRGFFPRLNAGKTLKKHNTKQKTFFHGRVV